jgi:hypothetical protein
MNNPTQSIRQAVTQNGTIVHQPMSSGIMTTPTSFVRFNQPQNIQQSHHITQNQGQYTPQTVWTNTMQQTSHPQFTLHKPSQQSPIVHYATVKNGERN